jgi:hypothetical protein
MIVARVVGAAPECRPNVREMEQNQRGSDLAIRHGVGDYGIAVASCPA